MKGEEIKKKKKEKRDKDGEGEARIRDKENEKDRNESLSRIRLSKGGAFFIELWGIVYPIVERAPAMLCTIKRGLS